MHMMSRRVHGLVEMSFGAQMAHVGSVIPGPSIDLGTKVRTEMLLLRQMMRAILPICSRRRSINNSNTTSNKRSNFPSPQARHKPYATDTTVTQQVAVY